MESLGDYEDGIFDNPDIEEEFRSCCAEDEEWKDTEESLVEGSKEDLDEFSLRMFFKGVSVSEAKGPKISGIGVVMERSHGVPALQVQKKLDFYVEELVAEHLALMDGLLVALQNGIRKVYAFTSSEKLYFQIAETEILEDQLLVALAHRILELAEKLEDFDLMLVPSFELERPSWLAQEAIGIKDLSSDGNGSVSVCPICCEENQSSQMIQIDCSHRFCSGCLITYVEGKIQASHVPIRCPQVRCKYNISTSECKSFLPVTSYELLERASREVGLHSMETLYCPFPNCSMLLNASQHLSSRASSSSLSDVNCVECPECRRDICISCGVPWHTMMTCDEYQSLPEEERDAGDMSLHLLAQNNRWRRCQQCRRMIELTQGCYHMTCWYSSYAFMLKQYNFGSYSCYIVPVDKKLIIWHKTKNLFFFMCSFMLEICHSYQHSFCWSTFLSLKITIPGLVDFNGKLLASSVIFLYKSVSSCMRLPPILGQEKGRHTHAYPIIERFVPVTRATMGHMARHNCHYWER